MTCINKEQLTEQVKKYSGTAMFIYTDKFCCRKFDKSIDDIEHLLEVRIFDEKREFKAIRPDIGKDFIWRELSDDIKKYAGFYDEVQYIDVDTQKTNGETYSFTGGGHYEMPENSLDRAVIRHYYKYDDDGIENNVDERIVKFLRKGEEYNGKLG